MGCRCQWVDRDITARVGSLESELSIFDSCQLTSANFRVYGRYRALNARSRRTYESILNIQCIYSIKYQGYIYCRCYQSLYSATDRLPRVELELEQTVVEAFPRWAK